MGKRSMLPIRVPALRERRDDIPALVEVLGEDMALRSGAQTPELGAEALALLSAQIWRGNIRELRNVLEQAMMRSDSHHIQVAQLQAVLRESGVAQVEPPRAIPSALTRNEATDLSELTRPLAEQVAELERRAIGAAMQTAKGNKAAVAKMLGISRAKLYERLDHESDKSV